MSNTFVIPKFNKEFFDLLDFLLAKAPASLKKTITDVVILAKKAKSANVALLITLWKKRVCNERDFVSAIKKGNLDFFINRDFGKELADMKASEKATVNRIIDSIRAPCRDLAEDAKANIVKRLQLLNEHAGAMHIAGSAKVAPEPLSGEESEQEESEDESEDSDEGESEESEESESEQEEPAAETKSSPNSKKRTRSVEATTPPPVENKKRTRSSTIVEESNE